MSQNLPRLFVLLAASLVLTPVQKALGEAKPPTSKASPASKYFEVQTEPDLPGGTFGAVLIGGAVAFTAAAVMGNVHRVMIQNEIRRDCFPLYGKLTSHQEEDILDDWASWGTPEWRHRRR